MEHPTATLGQMKIKKSLNVQVSINFISIFPITVSTRKMVSLFALKLLSMYFKFLVSIKFHAWVIFFSYFECQVINLIKVHNTPADKDWIFLIVQPCWSPLIVTTKQFLFSIATQIDANMILQNYPSNISDFLSVSASINSIESLLLCPLPFSASVFRSCLVRNRVKVTAWAAGSCRSWLLSLWLSSPASWPGCSVLRGRGWGDWSWSDHQGGQLAAHIQTNPFPLRRHSLCLTLPISWDSQIPEFSWSTAAIIAVADCRDCNAQFLTAHIFWLYANIFSKKHNLCVAAIIEDDVMRIDGDDETPKVEQINIII